MNEFFLGVLLGSGLSLAIIELRRQLVQFRARRWHSRAAQTIALLDECTCWAEPGRPHSYYCELENKPPTNKRFRSIVHP